MTVAPEPVSLSSREFPSAAVSRLTMTTRAPAVSGRKSSSAAMSKERVVTARSTSSPVSPGRERIEHRKFVKAPCAI